MPAAPPPSSGDLECLLISLWQGMGSDWVRLVLSTTTFQNEVVKGLWNGGEGERGVSPRGLPLGVCRSTYCYGKRDWGALMGGVGLWRRKEVLGRVSGSL